MKVLSGELKILPLSPGFAPETFCSGLVAAINKLHADQPLRLYCRERFGRLSLPAWQRGVISADGTLLHGVFD